MIYHLPNHCFVFKKNSFIPSDNNFYTRQKYCKSHYRCKGANSHNAATIALQNVHFERSIGHVMQKSGA